MESVDGDFTVKHYVSSDVHDLFMALYHIMNAKFPEFQRNCLPVSFRCSKFGMWDYYYGDDDFEQHRERLLLSSQLLAML
jgi:hypothetical protein